MNDHLEPYLVYAVEHGKLVTRTAYRPKGEGERVRLANAERKRVEEQRRRAGIEREIALRKLDALDPDWISKFRSTDAALNFYREELR